LVDAGGAAVARARFTTRGPALWIGRWMSWVFMAVGNGQPMLECVCVVVCDGACDVTVATILGSAQIPIARFRVEINGDKSTV
jgi:hypothetical protein